ncbi:AMP-binding protein [Mycobacterium marinum]|uniref:AMP-binding protein n=1 Tax=Mycobacterium marinum TaxID=1781 RepID=UPI00356902FC
MRGETDKATYARLDARARAIAFQLKSLGNQGDRVLLVMGNCLDYVVGFLACAYARRVAVNLPVPRRAKHLDRLPRRGRLWGGSLAHERARGERVDGKRGCRFAPGLPDGTAPRLAVGHP